MNNGNHYSINGNKILNGDKIAITTAEDIEGYLIWNDFIVVLVFPGEPPNERNIYCYKNDGKF
jgi:hypothetical protein